MNFIKRALLWTKAKKGRTLMLSAVFSAILIFVLSGLTIQSAAVKATENAQKSVGSTVTLSINREKMFQKSSSGTTPSPSSFKQTPVALSTVEKIAKLANVKNYSVTVSTSADAGSGIEAISSSSTTSSSTTSSSSSSNANGPGGQNGGGGMMQQSGDFQIVGTLESATSTSFSSGTSKIVSGSALTAADKGTANVLIEKTLATANSLKVGDTFTLKDSNSKTHTVTIKGIYQSSDSGSTNSGFNFTNPSNQIYTSYTLANTLKGTTTNTVDSAIFTLSDPAKTTTFVKQAKKLIDTDTFSLTSNSQTYESLLTPLNNVASFAKNIVILVAAAGVIILALIIMMAIRERRYEIGVLLSMGESKLKIISQFFIEVVLCMVVALVVATASGQVVGNVVGEQLLSQQSSSTTTSSSQQNGQQGGPGGGGGQNRIGNFGATSQASQAKIDKLNIRVSPKEIALLAGLGVGISFASILIGSAGILMMRPKKILTN